MSEQDTRKVAVPFVAGVPVLPPGGGRDGGDGGDGGQGGEGGSGGGSPAPAAAAMKRGPAVLPWQPQRMVRWFSPGELAATALRAVLSSVFGAYADRRELQAALHDNEAAGAGAEIHHYEGRADTQDGFWIDYVADLGDGFDSTYTVAWLLAQPSLPTTPADPGAAAAPVDRAAAPRDPAAEIAAGARTRRGQVLVMGGDQVYPTASREEYTNRMSGPYEAALPWHGQGEAPHLFAIPGNHDWYDGLTAFIRLFTQRRWIGGWKTQQTRSYFALQLPERWWLLGVDVQLASDIDQPQLEYFCRVAEQMQPGDRVILCTAEPAWVHTRSQPGAFDNLAFFENRVLGPRGAELALTLTGDLHHYSRYSDAAGGRHKITAGGGGAYLLGTQLLPADIELDAPRAETGPATGGDHAGHATERWERETLYPDLGRSLGLKLGALSLPWKNPSFALFLGAAYAVFAWFIQSASKVSAIFEVSLADGSTAGNFMDAAKAMPLSRLGDVAGMFLSVARYSPSVTALTLLFVGAMIAFTSPDVERSRLLLRHRRLRTAFRVAVGALHGAAHVALVVGLVWGFSCLFIPEDVEVARSWGVLLGFVPAMLVAGGVAGSLLMSLFLLPFVNYNEAFSAQRLETYKNFVRLRIGADGALSVFSYGVDAPARWRFWANAPAGEPYFTPAGAPPSIRLIDHVTLSGAPRAPLAESQHA